MNSTMALSGVETLRVQARRYTVERAATHGCSAYQTEVLRLLNEARSEAHGTGDQYLGHSNGRPGLTEYATGGLLLEVVREDLLAERIAIDSYRKAIQSLDRQDPATSTR